MMGHTPGPWRLVDDAQGPCMVMHPTADGVAIASLADAFHPLKGFVQIGSPGAPERTANARLIAAAPDLLAACEAVRRWVAKTDSGPYQQVCAAIDKATR